MTKEELYDFIHSNEIEIRWYQGEKILYCFLDFTLLSKFCKFCGRDIFEIKGLDCTLKHGYIVFDLCQVCSYFEIDPYYICNGKDK